MIWNDDSDTSGMNDITITGFIMISELTNSFFFFFFLNKFKGSAIEIVGSLIYLL